MLEALFDTFLVSRRRREKAQLCFGRIDPILYRVIVGIESDLFLAP